MEDLSRLLPGDPVSALAPTSQAGGNMISSNEEAMTAPGSQPVDVLKDRAVQSDPRIEASPGSVDPGDDGKPKARSETVRGAYSPASPSWGKTTTPDVVRES